MLLPAGATSQIETVVHRRVDVEDVLGTSHETWQFWKKKSLDLPAAGRWDLKMDF